MRDQHGLSWRRIVERNAAAAPASHCGRNEFYGDGAGDDRRSDSAADGEIVTVEENVTEGSGS